MNNKNISYAENIQAVLSLCDSFLRDDKPTIDRRVDLILLIKQAKEQLTEIVMEEHYNKSDE